MKKPHLSAASAIVSLAIATALVGCSASTPDGDAAAGDSIFIGGIWPLSGAGALTGQTSAIGAEIAIEELNAAGDTSYEYQWEDSQLDTQLGVTILERLIGDDADVILSGGSGVLVAQAPVMDRQQVPVLNNMAQSPMLAGLSDWLFNIIPTSSAELEGIAELAINERGYETVATLAVDNDLGIGDVEELTGLIEDAGGQVIANESFPVGASDMRTALTRIRDAAPDALYITGNSDEVGYAIAQASELNLDAQLLIRTPGIDPSSLSIAGEAANGAIGVATAFRPSEDNQIAQDFIDAYMEKSDGEAPSTFAAIAYDAVRLIGAAYDELGSDATPEDVAAWLNSVQEFPGAMGLITISEGTAAYPLFQFEVMDGLAEPFES
ncbi:branched-chain amino acid ABC transporter substrate-binding protein [Agrococcus baldri]|uniref:Branched-chain amino acid ABC transporter substrate-binding protein n=2 Tax=Agrococcus baldri TaxID=153730 RepID=A0AA87UR37_9MICO|nr:branched-chain amino acid ABC transporter substrate-binding protein [Agrococcus baldri]